MEWGVHFSKWYHITKGFSGGSGGKEFANNLGDLGSIPESRRSAGGGHGNPLQYSCLENLMDRGAWKATVPRVTEWDMTEETLHDYCSRSPSLQILIDPH